MSKCWLWGGLLAGAVIVIGLARWVELRVGDRLDPFDAVLTCASGWVVLRSNHGVGLGRDWVETEYGRVRTLREKHYLALLLLGVPPEKIDVEVLDVSGPVFYSQDRESVRY